MEEQGQRGAWRQLLSEDVGLGPGSLSTLAVRIGLPQTVQTLPQPCDCSGDRLGSEPVFYVTVWDLQGWRAWQDRGSSQEMIVLAIMEIGILEPLDSKSACVWLGRVTWTLGTGGGSVYGTNISLDLPPGIGLPNSPFDLKH